MRSYFCQYSSIVAGMLRTGRTCSVPSSFEPRSSGDSKKYMNIDYLMARPRHRVTIFGANACKLHCRLTACLKHLQLGENPFRTRLLSSSMLQTSMVLNSSKCTVNRSRLREAGRKNGVHGSSEMKINKNDNLEKRMLKERER